MKTNQIFFKNRKEEKIIKLKKDTNPTPNIYGQVKIIRHKSYLTIPY